MRKTFNRSCTAPSFLRMGSFSSLCSELKGPARRFVPEYPELYVYPSQGGYRYLKNRPGNTFLRFFSRCFRLLTPLNESPCAFLGKRDKLSQPECTRLYRLTTFLFANKQKPMNNLIFQLVKRKPE